MGRYLMDKAFDMIRDLVTGLTGILVGVIGLGVVAGIVFDNNAWFFGGVLRSERAHVWYPSRCNRSWCCSWYCF